MNAIRIILAIGWTAVGTARLVEYRGGGRRRCLVLAAISLACAIVTACSIPTD